MENPSQITRRKINIYLDFIPFAVLIIYTINLVWKSNSLEYTLVWQHYAGLLLLPVIGFLFYKNHHWSVIALGAILLLAIIGLISFSPVVITTWFGIGKPEFGWKQLVTDMTKSIKI